MSPDAGVEVTATLVTSGGVAAAGVGRGAGADAVGGPGRPRATRRCRSWRWSDPVTVCEVVLAPLPETSVQSWPQLVPPSSLTRYWYLVIAESEGPVQVSETRPLSGVAVRPVGAAGTTLKCRAVGLLQPPL